MNDDDLPELDLDDEAPELRTTLRGTSSTHLVRTASPLHPRLSKSDGTGVPVDSASHTSTTDSTSAVPAESGAQEAVNSQSDAVGHPSTERVQPTSRIARTGIVIAAATAFIGIGLSCAGVGGYFTYDRYWNTPDRALKGLVDAAAEGDLAEARRLVAPSAWGITEPAVPEGLARTLTHIYEVDHVSWDERSQDAAAKAWTKPTSIPEVTATFGIWMGKKDGRWKLVRYEGGLDDDVIAATELVADLRSAAKQQDAERFLEPVVPGANTCEGKACKSVAEAVSQGQSTPMVDVVGMVGAEATSVQVTRDGDDIVLRWLRKTRYLEQFGMSELRFRRVNGRWMVVSTNGENYRLLDEEMETWTENHGEMLWRAELANYVEVKSLDSYCSEWFLGRCITKVLPTYVKNIGTKVIKSIKVSKVRSLRYMGNASQTLWGIFRNVAPGVGTSDPSTSSPPVRSNRELDINETWEFYRVNWVEFEDGTRLDYSPRDYRDSEGGTLAFEDVRDARRDGGLSVSAYDKLARELEANGYNVKGPPNVPVQPVAE